MMLDVAGICIAILTGTVAAVFVEMMVLAYAQKRDEETSEDDSHPSNHGDE